MGEPSQDFKLSLGPDLWYLLVRGRCAVWDSTHFRGPFSGGGNIVAHIVLKNWGSNHIKFGTAIDQSLALSTCRFQVLNALLHFKTKVPKRPNFELFDPCKVGEGIGDKSDSLHINHCSDMLLHFESRTRQRRLESKMEAKYRLFDPPQ